MRRTLVLAVLAASFSLVAAPRAARACGTGYGGSGLAIIGLVATGMVVGDVAMLASDGVIASWGEVPSAGHGVGELLLGLPTAAIGGLALVGSLQPSGRVSGADVAISASIFGLGFFMTSHAIWTFAAQADPPRKETRLGLREPRLLAPGAAPQPPPPPPAPLPVMTLAVAPTALAVHDRTGDKVAPGIGALVRF